MIQSLVYGLTIGAILYFFSIGLSITFGTMQIINFAHGMIYALGVYFFISLLAVFGGMVPLAVCGALVFAAPVAYVTERFVIRRLYGESLDYAMIATYALLLIGTDIIKFFWGTTPYPVTDPIGTSVHIFGFSLPVYRILIIALAVLLFLGLNQLTRRTVVGKIVVAALEDKEGVRCLGINVDQYFSWVFVLGSLLAVVGGVLYAPISTAEPYMWVQHLIDSICRGHHRRNGKFDRNVCGCVRHGSGNRLYRKILVTSRRHHGLRCNGAGSFLQTRGTDGRVVYFSMQLRDHSGAATLKG